MDALEVSTREHRRLTELSLVKRGRPTVAEATRRLGLSKRQTRRLWKRYQSQGDAGVRHGLRGDCSKYHPIERRFFPRVARACQGVRFDTLDTVVRMMRRAATSAGLKTTVNVIRRVYDTGRKVADDFKATMTLLVDDLPPQWNYVAVPPPLQTVDDAPVLKRFPRAELRP
jgi:hypothetical protein